LSKIILVGYINSMADQEKKEQKNGTEDQEKKPSKKILLIIIIASILLVLLITTVATAIFLTKKPEPKIEMQTEEMLTLVPMREFLVNLIDYGGRRYLKVALDLEVNNSEAMEEIIAKETILRNYIINILSSKTFNDVKSIEGKNALRKTIILKSNFILKKGKVLNVYFNEFIIQ